MEWKHAFTPEPDLRPRCAAAECDNEVLKITEPGELTQRYKDDYTNSDIHIQETECVECGWTFAIVLDTTNA